MPEHRTTEEVVGALSRYVAVALGMAKTPDPGTPVDNVQKLIQFMLGQAIRMAQEHAAITEDELRRFKTRPVKASPEVELLYVHPDDGEWSAVVGLPESQPQGDASGTESQTKS